MGYKGGVLTKNRMYEQYDQTEPEKIEQTNWEVLSDNRCPKCELKLFRQKFMWECTCGFKISPIKLEKIATEQQLARLSASYRKRLEENKKINFKQAKTFEDNKPKFNINDLIN